MEYELILRWLHVVGACVLLGTGAGIAFFMVMAHRSGDARIIAHTSGVVVIADFLFTATAVIAQPITGLLLARSVGWSLTEGWIVISLLLYIVTGAFWLPVVWIQKRLCDLAREAAAAQTALPASYTRLYYTWFAFGIPAFTSVLAIVWLMLARPVISF